MRTYVVHLDNGGKITIPGVSSTELSDKKWLSLYAGTRVSPGIQLLGKFNMDRVLYITVEYADGRG